MFCFHVATRFDFRFRNFPRLNKTNNIKLLSLWFEVALMHIPYTVEFINRKLTNRIDF